MNYPWQVIVLAALLLGNRVSIRVSVDRPWVFWGVEVLNLAAMGWVGILGLDGMENFPVANWLVVALLGFHMVQNYSLRQRVLLERRSEEQFRENLRKMRNLEGE
jgi:hypothetical protein